MIECQLILDACACSGGCRHTSELFNILLQYDTLTLPTGWKSRASRLIKVKAYRSFCWLNLTILSTEPIIKNMRMGSSRMYWERVMQPVSVKTMVKNHNTNPQFSDKGRKSFETEVTLSSLVAIYYHTRVLQVFNNLGYVRATRVSI